MEYFWHGLSQTCNRQSFCLIVILCLNILFYFQTMDLGHCALLVIADFMHSQMGLKPSREQNASTLVQSCNLSTINPVIVLRQWRRATGFISSKPKTSNPMTTKTSNPMTTSIHNALRPSCCTPRNSCRRKTAA